MSIELLATSIADRAYERIRVDIIFGRLVPSSRLRLDRLAGEYGAGVSTLREILSRLSSEGLVTAEGQRGFRVAPVSAKGFQDVAAMRLLLETFAVRLSFAAGDLEWESRVVAAHHKLAVMERRMIACDQADPETWKRCDWEFHQALISACGSKMLVETHAAVFDKYLRYQMIALSYRGEIAAGEHALLRDCAIARDADQACAVLRRHVAGGVEHALATGTIS